MTIAFKSLWKKLSQSKKYREHFVEAQVKRGLPAQIRALMKQQNLTQKQLAERARLTQGVISRAANPSYGNLTVNTIIRIAAGLDVAFIGRFVPFSELTAWFDNIGRETSFVVAPFKEENKRFSTGVIDDTPSDEGSTSRETRLHRIPLNPAKMTLGGSTRHDEPAKGEDTNRNVEYARL
jgi:transcriptional regulator with XRE-family HTH domain